MSNRWKYTDEYRRDVASRVIDGNQSSSRVAQELGLVLSTVQNWVKKEQARRHTEATGEPDPAQTTAENRRLKEENAQLKTEVEFLKKASAFFAAQLTRP